MTIALEPSKRPDEERVYKHDWTPWLGAATIASQTTTADVDSGIVVSDVAIETGDKSITFKVSGGDAGSTGRVTQTITSSTGEIETEVFLVRLVAAEEPVSLAEVKKQLRIEDDNTEDALISSYTRSARAYVESESGFVFVRRQFVETFNRWPLWIELGRRPVISVDLIEYQDTDGTTQEYADFFGSLPLRRIHPATSWPTLGTNGSISVRYTAGFAEGEQVEELDLARQAIFVLVAHWFANREAVSTSGLNVMEIPFTVRSLIDRFRAQVI